MRNVTVERNGGWASRVGGKWLAVEGKAIFGRPEMAIGSLMEGGPLRLPDGRLFVITLGQTCQVISLPTDGRWYGFL